MNKQKTQINTERLILRHHNTDDAKKLYELFGKDNPESVEQKRRNTKKHEKICFSVFIQITSV